MKNTFSLILIGLMMLTASCSHQGERVSSPDGKLVLTLRMNEQGTPLYAVTREGHEVVAESALGLKTAEECFCCGLTLVGTESSKSDETWETTWGEEQFIRDQHKQMVAHFQTASGAKMDVVFRVFNDGYAFRYVFPKQDAISNLTITDDRSEFRLTMEADAWSIPYKTAFYEALWSRAPLAQKDTMCSPITLEIHPADCAETQYYAFLHEAALTDYPAANFYCHDGAVRVYLTPWREDNHDIEARAYVEAPFATPWRMMILTKNLPDMVASRIMLNLNEPCKIEDTSWIRPMKFLGIWWGMHLHMWTWRIGPNHGATTEHMKQYLSFAAENGIQAVLAEGWNRGWEGYEGINPGERFSFVRTYADWDQAEIQRHADSLGVEVICHHETCGNADQYEAEMEEAYEYMKKYNMTAVKTGYVQPIISTVSGRQWSKSQAGVRHYRKVIETAARYHVTIDNHEPVMPTGLQRTYPNLMTQEGIRGQEWNAWSRDGGSPCEHVTVLPYTRMMAGPADYTPGVFNFYNPIIPGTRVHSTLMNQLALFVCIYSPLQMACDLPEHYAQYPDAFRFISEVPCDWKKSILLDGKIGDYCIFARQDRNSDNWYIGGITDEEAREVEIRFDYLDKNATYTATLWRDGDEADWVNRPYDYEIETMTVTCASEPIKVRMATGGGLAMTIIKQN